MTNYKLLSIDVGIKNCAYALMSIKHDVDDDISIDDWGVLSLLNENDKVKNCNTIDFVSLGKNLNIVFTTTFRDKLPKDCEIVIENQIGQNAIRMKCLQGMITQWFIDNGYEFVSYVSSSHKLNYILKENDLFNGDKMTYAHKKKLSIQIMKNILEHNSVLNHWTEFFNSSNKKDDLSDCFLQGYYYLNKKGINSKKLIISTYHLKL